MALDHGSRKEIKKDVFIVGIISSLIPVMMASIPAFITFGSIMTQVEANSIVLDKRSESDYRVAAKIDELTKEIYELKGSLKNLNARISDLIKQIDRHK